MNLRTAFAGLLLLMPAAAAAQDPLIVRGTVIGPDSKPLAGQVVVLHRVSAGGGATVAQDTASTDGRFELHAPPTTDTEAVYFVAGRFQEEMYLVPPFRAQEAGPDQILQVGVPGTSASSLLGSAAGAPLPAAGRPATSRSWFLIAIPLVGVAAVALFTLPKGRVPRQRALLIRVAELDERMTTEPEAHRETLRAERATLIARLRGA